MPKYISVLTSSEDLGYWSAVQWADSEAAINSNQYYTAGETLALSKNDKDKKIGTKKLTEVATLTQATASVYQLA